MFTLPVRYRRPFDEDFHNLIKPRLTPGVRVLDVGSGRRPAIAIEQRPDNCTYVGLDIVGEELAIAPPGAYTDTWTADITEPLPNELREQFDVVISFQAIEHVDSVPRALREMRAALRPGGLLVFQTSGAFGILPAMVNRVLPRRASLWLLRRLTGRDPETVFPAVYDQCWASALRRLLTSWQNVQVLPREWGGFYLLSAPYLLWPYLLWEELVRRAGWENLATHYLVAAELPGAPASTEIRE